MIDAGGSPWHFGPTNDPVSDPAPTVVVRLADRATELTLARDPYLALGEAYMDGRLTMIEGSLYDLLALLMVDSTELRSGMGRGLEQLRRGTRRLAQYNPSDRARRNVAHHYDIDGSIYDLFLDSDRQYSCAYFPEREGGGIGLEEAQRLKKRHIAAKLALQPGHRVLDIGSGWADWRSISPKSAMPT